VVALREKLNEDTRQLDDLCFAIRLEQQSTLLEKTKLVEFLETLLNYGCNY
jgi:hypothetical protein